MLNCLTSDGSSTFVGGSDGALYWWDGKGGGGGDNFVRIETPHGQQPITCICASEDGGLFVTGAEDGSIATYSRPVSAKAYAYLT